MGMSGSKETEYADRLNKFLSTEPIKSDDEYWGLFLKIPYRMFLGELYVKEDDDIIKEQQTILLTNNIQSANFTELMKQCIVRLETKPLTDSVAEEVANGILIFRTYLKFMVESVPESTILSQCNMIRSDEPEPLPGEPSPFETFLRTLINFLAMEPVTYTSRLVHVECASCLLVLLAVQLYSDQPTYTFYIYRCIMQGGDPAIGRNLTQALLLNFVNDTLPEDPSGSVVINLATNLINLLTPKPGDDGRTDELSNLSVWLLLVFTYHCTNDRHVANPFRRPLFTFYNVSTHSLPSLDDDVEMAIEAEALARQMDPPLFEVNFPTDLSRLYHALCSSLENEGATLLLYTLLHRNINVRTYFMARTDIELMIVPILKTLYGAGSCGSYHIYMSLVIILIFSEDDLFSKTVHHIQVKNIPWFTERTLREISLGGLIVLVLLRTIHLNIMTMRDKYLHSNCLASLANMGSTFTNLHPYVCQRFIDLFETLAKRYERLKCELYPTARKSPDPSLPPAEGTSSPVEQSDELKAHQYAVLEEGLRSIAETINVALRYNLRGNPNLIYAILHKKDVFGRFHCLPEFREATDAIFEVIAHFNPVLERIQEEPTESMVIAAIVEGSLRLHFTPPANGQEMKFKYIEEEISDNFFLPYVWSVILNHSQLLFSTSNVRTRIGD